MSKKTKEELYHEVIEPALRALIELCAQHDIPMLASFQLNEDRTDLTSLAVTAAWLPSDTHPNMHDAASCLEDGSVIEDLGIDEEGQVAKAPKIIN